MNSKQWDNRMKMSILCDANKHIEETGQGGKETVAQASTVGGGHKDICGKYSGMMTKTSVARCSNLVCTDLVSPRGYGG